MKCVAKVASDDPEARILCDDDTDYLYSGSSLCHGHVIAAYERTESESGFGALFKGLEKITLDDVAKISAMMRPLMQAFSSSGSRGLPATLECTIGCKKGLGHLGECG